MWHHHDGMGWWMIFGVVWMVAFWGGIVALVVWAIRRITGTSESRKSSKSDPLDIAKERLAKGEISREEFDRIKDALK